MPSRDGCRSPSPVAARVAVLSRSCVWMRRQAEPLSLTTDACGTPPGGRPVVHRVLGEVVVRRPSAALVISWIAMFIALGGPAVAQRAVREISGKRLVDGSVTGVKIRDGSLSVDELTTAARRILRTPRRRSVTTSRLAPSAVGSTAIAAAAVRGEDIAPGAVGPTSLAADAVTGAKVADGSLSAVDLSRHRGTTEVDFPAIAPGLCAASPVKLSGDTSVKDRVALVTAPSNWPQGAQVTATLGPGDGAFSIGACNFTGGPVDPGPANFRYVMLDL